MKYVVNLQSKDERCATPSRPRSRSGVNSRSRRMRTPSPQGCEITELTGNAHVRFKRAVEPLRADARKQFGQEMFELMPG